MIKKSKDKFVINKSNSVKASLSIGLVVCFSGIGCLFSNIALSENNYNAQATLESSTFSNVLTKPYRVKRGDSLWKIAKKYRPSKRITTSDMLVAIKKLNKYKLNGNSALSVGMRLSLPKSITSVKEILSAKPTPKRKIKTPKPIVKKLETKKLTKKLTKEVTRKEASLKISAKPINSSSAVYQPLDPKKISFKDQPYKSKTPKDKINLVQDSSTESGGSASWMVISLFFMLTTAFLYWKLRQSQGGNGASLSAALRLGIRSKKKPFDHKSEPSEFSVETVSEPKLNINVDLENQVGNDPFPDINSFNIDSSELDELALIKNRVSAAPHSVDLRLDLLRKLVKLDDQEGFKKAVDELTPLLTEEHQAVWSDIRSMYFGKWAYDA